MSVLGGRHALVTGGGSGIGAAIARALVDAGAAVTIAGRDKAKLDAMARALKCASVVADVTREADCAAMVAAARAQQGPLDLVIANAGAAESAPFGKIDSAHWQRMIDVNLTGSFNTARAALADLTRAGAGEGGRRLVFIASTAALKGYPYVAAYVAAKHGVLGLARALSAELAATGVTVNAVCPGYTDTPLLNAAAEKISAKTGRSAEDSRAILAKDNPSGRLIKPEEVAQAVLQLCLPSAGSKNGQIIAVTGDLP